jgi:TusA-related sulfurtransferase
MKPDAELDGGDMDCGSGLLLLLTRRMREIEPGQSLLVHTQERSVPPDLDDWGRLAGHLIVSSTAAGPDGPWEVLVRRDGSKSPVSENLDLRSVFSEGTATPIGSRLWLYSNFHCNLACNYCCAESSPKAIPRLLSVELALAATTEFRQLGGAEVIVTGGEPFLHPDLGPMVVGLAALLPVTILTNGMVFDRGRRREALMSMPRDRVVLQISLDSAGPTLHDRHRGIGSHAKALAGMALARELGFTLRVAATLQEDEAVSAAALTQLLDSLGVDESHRIIRPVAKQGFALEGQAVTVDSLEPEPTLTVDGIWWHPVAVNDPAMQVATSPLPIAAALDTIRDTLAVQDAARREGRRHVFRCA